VPPPVRLQRSLPTEAQLVNALSKLRDAPEGALDVLAPVRKVASFEGPAAPTLQDIGRLYVWILDARSYLNEGLRYVEELEHALGRLDEVRLCENVNPDEAEADVA
jgi:hypothetical protein